LKGLFVEHYATWNTTASVITWKSSASPVQPENVNLITLPTMNIPKTFGHGVIVFTKEQTMLAGKDRALTTLLVKRALQTKDIDVYVFLGSMVITVTRILTSVLQDTSVMSTLCVIIPKDPTVALVTTDIMAMDEIAQMLTSVPQAFTVAMPTLILFVIIPMARTTVFVLMDFLRMEQIVKMLTSALQELTDAMLMQYAIIRKGRTTAHVNPGLPETDKIV